MRETITMTTVEQRRAWVLAKVMAGEIEVAQAAELLGLSVRSVWRLKRRFGEEGPAGLVHGNRGRPSPRRIDEAIREQVRALARGRYDGANDSHLAELLAEREGISVTSPGVAVIAPSRTQTSYGRWSRCVRASTAASEHQKRTGHDPSSQPGSRRLSSRRVRVTT
jgi:transposase